MRVLAVDPGREKCGVAVCGPEGVVAKGVVSVSDLPGLVRDWTHDYGVQAVVVGGNRIPFARTGGAYTKSSNQDMLTAALEGLIARFGLQDERIGEVAGAGAAAAAVLSDLGDRARAGALARAFEAGRRR